jgi:hypothetical protein
MHKKHHCNRPVGSSQSGPSGVVVCGTPLYVLPQPSHSKTLQLCPGLSPRLLSARRPGWPFGKRQVLPGTPRMGAPQSSTSSMSAVVRSRVLAGIVLTGVVVHGEHDAGRSPVVGSGRDIVLARQPVE